MYKIALLNHKCGTVFFRSLLSKVCSETNINYVRVPRPLDNIEKTKLFFQEKIIRDRFKYIRFIFGRGSLDTLFFVPNSIYQLLEKVGLTNYRAFMMVRDPRDIIVSGYFSHKNSHSTESWKDLENIRKKLNELSLNDGLMYEINRGYALHWLRSIEFDNPKIKIVRFEDFIQDNFQVISEIFEFLKIKISARQIGNLLEKNSFEKRAGGRKRGEENQNHHFRKGIAGDWKNYFTDEHCKIFNEKWGDLLIQLGYEKDDSWAKLIS